MTMDIEMKERMLNEYLLACAVCDWLAEKELFKDDQIDIDNLARDFAAPGRDEKGILDVLLGA